MTDLLVFRIPGARSLVGTSSTSELITDISPSMFVHPAFVGRYILSTLGMKTHTSLVKNDLYLGPSVDVPSLFLLEGRTYGGDWTCGGDR